MVETISYTIGRQAIQIPVDHPLPRFQETLQLYERFPFFLATACNKGEWIIDVGAKIGDSTAAFIQATEGSVLAAEGFGDTFQLLEANVNGLSPHLSSRIRLVNLHLGTGRYALKCVSVDEMLLANDISPQSVAVLSDTNDHDPDVLLSATHLMQAGSPILYFENEFEDRSQMDEFALLYKALDELGYRTFWIIDNFGNPLVDRIPPSCLPALANYLQAGISGRTRRTIHYYDIVACKEDKIALVDKVVANFREFVNLDEAATGAAYHYRP